MASTLSAGDIAIIGYLAGGNASSSQPDESSFSFITFTNLDPGTDIYLTNNAWTGSNFNGVTPTTLNGAEELTRFTTSSSIPAGTIVRSYDPSTSGSWTTSGSIVDGTNNGSYSRLNLATPSQGGDQITGFQVRSSSIPVASDFVPLYQLEYTGTSGNANSGNIVTGLSNDGTGANANTATVKTNDSTAGVFRAKEFDNLTTKAEWLQAVNIDTNWRYDSSFDTTNLPSGSVALAPEPITMFGSLTALVIGAGLKQFRKKFQ